MKNATDFLKMNPYCTQIIIYRKIIKSYFIFYRGVPNKKTPNKNFCARLERVKRTFRPNKNFSSQ